MTFSFLFVAWAYYDLSVYKGLSGHVARVLLSDISPAEVWMTTLAKSYEYYRDGNEGYRA